MSPGKITILPQEILEQVISHLPSARDVSNFAQCSREIHKIVETDGWRVFATVRFPSITTPPFWKDAAHALSTLSRNIDRRAFLSYNVEPEGEIHSLPGKTVQPKWNRPKGQTMGYQAVLDSYETWTGNDWISRKTVVAWGAGAELVLNVSKQLTISPQKPDASSSRESEDLAREPHRSHTSSSWLTYREDHHAEGHDDITSASILNPSQRHHNDDDPNLEHVLIGRASGELTSVGFKSGVENCVLRQFDTAGSSVRSASVGPNESHLVAACLGDDRLAVYPLYSRLELVSPSSETICIPQGERSCRTWSTTFLSSTRIAIGMGPSVEIVRVFDLSSTGVSREPLRSFGHGKSFRTSAYPVRPLPTSSTSAGRHDSLLLSGCYDGIIRLYDLRSPKDSISDFRDPIDDSPLFSLEIIGRERIIAGSANHSLLKVFDLRMCGGRAYSYAEVPKVLPNGVESETDSTHHESNGTYASGFNIFVGQNRQIHSNRRRQPREGPIYSLSRPSASSPVLFAGLENSVVGFNFTSVTDAHPDPVFNFKLRFNPRKRFSPFHTWFSSTVDPFALTVYEQLGERRMQMLYQRNPSKKTYESGSDIFQDSEAGYDERLSRISTRTRLSAARSNFR